jgi:tRNA pseudouridine38-40 synthase
LTRTIKLTIEYDGTHYLGWQRQPQGMTIQQALEEAVEQITGATASVTGSGRTDSGVHARGQVASFQTESEIPAEKFQKALNAVLQRDIAVLVAEDVDEDFNARFSAKGKRYEYTIWNDPTRPVLNRHIVCHYRKRLDIDLMREGSQYLLGSHDFKAFESSGAASNTTTRTVTLAEWAHVGSELVFGIEANGFLYNMVRAIVGSLVEIGLAKQPPSWIGDIIASRDRTQAGPTAPPQGLCLMRVDY